MRIILLSTSLQYPWFICKHSPPQPLKVSMRNGDPNQDKTHPNPCLVCQFVVAPSPRNIFRSSPVIKLIIMRMLEGNVNRMAKIPTQKLSDFSIDHILNRAGATSLQADTSSSIFYTRPELCGLNRSLVGQNSTTTTLNWLQYSRYHPPKLQRQVRTGPAKRTPGRLPRVPFTPEQLSTLENAYRRSTYLSSEEANKLADRLDLSNVRVKIWFQNRRARERREKRDSQIISNNFQDNCDVLDVETIDESDNTSNSSL